MSPYGRKIALGWLPKDLIDGKSALVQVMAWCRQAIHWLYKFIHKVFGGYWIVSWKSGVCSVLNSVMSVRLLGENYVFDIPSNL